MRVCVIIPAAGGGQRFGGDKLAEDLGGSSVLARSIALFRGRADVHAIIVAGPPEDEAFARFAHHHRDALAGARTTLVRGGRRERWETVRKALAALPADCTHVAVHDAARPAAPTDLIDRVFRAAEQYDAVIPGLAVSATLKRIGDPVAPAGHGRAAVAPAIETVPRAGLVAVQTPQVFRRELLVAAYESLDRQGALDGVTDDAQVVERSGGQVMVVAGDARNIKMTTPDDLPLLRAIVSAGQASTDSPMRR
jgi:2-C-methyl-D-erythritol 4-phosphate cytidylyltransferase